MKAILGLLMLLGAACSNPTAPRTPAAVRVENETARAIVIRLSSDSTASFSAHTTTCRVLIAETAMLQVLDSLVPLHLRLANRWFIDADSTGAFRIVLQAHVPPTC